MIASIAHTGADLADTQPPREWRFFLSREYFQPDARKSARNAGRGAEGILAQPAGSDAHPDAPARCAAAGEDNDEKEYRQRAVAGGDEWRPASVPDTSSLTKVREAALHCTACPLYKNATQTVFGEGPERPTLILLGEQPGDREDLSGKPFIGPAGQILNRALEEAGIDRNEV
jgi:hypothetical protein